jgi:phosphoribosylformylglycinamidine cyclo-ligase
MLRIFNCGIGMVLIVDEEIADDIGNEINKFGLKSFNLGRVIANEEDSVIYS